MRSPRNRNIISSAAAQSTIVDTINAFMGNDIKPAIKNMLQNLLGTGNFDDVVGEHANAMGKNTFSSPNLNLTIVNSGEDIVALHSIETKNSKIAEKQREAKMIHMRIPLL